VLKVLKVREVREVPSLRNLTAMPQGGSTNSGHVDGDFLRLLL